MRNFIHLFCVSVCSYAIQRFSYIKTCLHCKPYHHVKKYYVCIPITERYQHSVRVTVNVQMSDLELQHEPSVAFEIQQVMIKRRADVMSSSSDLLS